MRQLLFAIVVIFSLSAFISSGNNKKIFKQLYALEGVWEMNTKRGTICEEWKIIGKNYLQK